MCFVSLFNLFPHTFSFSYMQSYHALNVLSKPHTSTFMCVKFFDIPTLHTICIQFAYIWENNGVAEHGQREPESERQRQTAKLLNHTHRINNSSNNISLFVLGNENIVQILCAHTHTSMLTNRVHLIEHWCPYEHW